MRNGGYTTKGPLYISGQKIRGIRDPKKDGEAVNKRLVVDYIELYANDYVKIFKDKNHVFVSPWGINIVGKRLSGLSIPAKSDEAATKEYVDRELEMMLGSTLTKLPNYSEGVSTVFLSRF